MRRRDDHQSRQPPAHPAPEPGAHPHDNLPDRRLHGGPLPTITALLALRLYADHNLKLVARAISYTAEAAVVFDDKDAAKDALEAITSREDVASARILLPGGQVLASWRRDITTLEHAGAASGPSYSAGTCGAAHSAENKEIAQVHLVGHGQHLLRFLLQTLMATLLCLLLGVWGRSTWRAGCSVPSLPPSRP